MLTMVLVIGCNDNLDDEIAENAKKIVHGAASVKQMAKNCETPSDYSGDKEASGFYALTNNSKPNWVPYPRRSNNIIVDKLKWKDDESPIKNQLAIENNHGHLKVKLALVGQEELEGKIYAPQD